MPKVTSVTIRYRVERSGYTVSVSETYRPKPKKREPKKRPSRNRGLSAKRMPTRAAA